MKISVDYINKLARLDDDSLNEIKELISEYPNIMRVLKEKVTMWHDGWEIFSISTTDVLSNGNLLIKPVSDLESIINKYKNIIAKLVDLNFLHFVYDTFYNENKRNDLLNAIDDIIKDKKIVIDNMNKFMDLGIREFEYNSIDSLDGRYAIYINYNPDTSFKENSYGCDGVCSDGVKTWKHNFGYYYYFDLDNAKYVIIYKKRFDDRYNEIEVIVNDLNFDTNTLPNGRELHELSIAPYVDYQEVSLQTALLKHNNLESDLIIESNKIERLLNLYINNSANCPKGTLSLNDLALLISIRNDLSLFISKLDNKENGKVLKRRKDNE